MTLYLDIFFLVNFISDFFIMLASVRIKGGRISFKKTAFAAFFGASYACFLTVFPAYFTFFFNMAAFLLMSFLLSGFGSFISFFQNTLCLFMCFFISGGAFYALSYFMGAEKIYILWLSVITALFISFFLSKKIRLSKVRSYGKITVYKDGKKYFLNALFDSGNMATDPFSHLPLIICEDVFGEIKKTKTPIITASGKGEVKTFTPDFIKIEYGKDIYTGKNAAIGIIEGKLTFDNSFNALIGGICFDGLHKEVKGAFREAFYRGNFLYRRHAASSPASFGEGGDGAS